MGDRSRLGSKGIGLTTHIDDVSNLLWFEDLHDVVLVGWSYGAWVVEGVADVMPERLRMVVNHDGGPVAEGQSISNEIEADDPIRAWLQRDEPVPPPTEAELADALEDVVVRRFVAERERSQPARGFSEAYPERGGRRASVPHVYLACMDQAIDTEGEAHLARLRNDDRWEVAEVQLNHLGVLYAPKVVADALHAIAT
jgi:pimeloyl-ACP methyl ester carboxylesterase